MPAPSGLATRWHADLGGAAPHYHHRRPPISGAPSTVVRTSPSRHSLRMVFEGQRTMVPGLARSRPGARSRGHDIVQSGRFRTPAIADLHERPVISKRLPPSTPRVGNYRQSTTRREESGPADSARRSSTVSLPLGRVFSESTAANGDCDSVVIGLIGGGLVGDSQARCELQGDPTIQCHPNRRGSRPSSRRLPAVAPVQRARRCSASG